jgi:hypothetical protein
MPRKAVKVGKVFPKEERFVAISVKDVDLQERYNT